MYRVLGAYRYQRYRVLGTYKYHVREVYRVLDMYDRCLGIEYELHSGLTTRSVQFFLSLLHT